MTIDYMKAPYVYFGGKSAVAEYTWTRFGEDVDGYVEPFMGSCAMLLGRPGWTPRATYKECVNDKSGFLVNFWRSVQADPEAVAYYADFPAFENELHARHAYLIGRRNWMVAKLEGDPGWYNARIAGWWVWGMALWIGHGFCSSKGPWRVIEAADGTKELVRLPDKELDGQSRQLINFGGMQGVKRGCFRNDSANGRATPVHEWMNHLSARFKHVRVACGNWDRVCTDSTTIHTAKVNAIFLDPPYGGASGRVEENIYADDDPNVAAQVLEWCKERGTDNRFRICLAGYDGEHNILEEKYGWDVYKWQGPAGYANQGATEAKEARKKERLWFSPYCLPPKKKPSLGLFK